jgi:hypothetical protein
MSRAARLAASAAAALVVTGAKANEFGVFLVAAGAVFALLAVLGLPLGLLVHACRRDWIAAEARALERRATACVLIGAGAVVAAVIAFAALAKPAPGLAVVVAVGATAWFFVGFAGCARLHGERMLGASREDAGPRALLLGWLARAGLIAVPVVWPFVGTYVVVAAFGAPFAALLERPAAPPPA